MTTKGHTFPVEKRRVYFVKDNYERKFRIAFYNLDPYLSARLDVNGRLLH